MLAVASAAADVPFNTWRQHLGGADSSQYSSLKQINKSNVKQLQIVWTYPAGEGSYLFNPIVIDNVIYVQAKNNSLVALDALTGEELWTHPFQGPVVQRGIDYWESRDRADRRLLTINAGFLTAIDARTGQTIASFGDNGRADLRPGLDFDWTNVPPIHTNNPGRIFEDIMIVPLMRSGSDYAYVPGDIHAYSVRTGKLLWQFHTVPRPGETGYETWPKDFWQRSGGGINWSELTIDEKRGIAYTPTGTGKWDYYGADRKGTNLFANSVVALDVRTGKRLWHFQTVHHDLWDYDLPAGPKLLTIRHNGRKVDVVIQPSKQGFLYVLDRVTGQPIWPMEERPVPKSDVPGEESWPTQPFPTRPPPFARQALTENDVNPYIPADEQALTRPHSQRAKRRTIHAAQLQGNGRNTRKQRRRELGHGGRRPGEGRAVHCVARPAYDADPGSAGLAPRKRRARHSRRHAAAAQPRARRRAVHPLRRTESGLCIGQYASAIHLAAVVSDDRVRHEHGDHKVAGSLRRRAGVGRARTCGYRRDFSAERRPGGDGGRTDLQRDERQEISRLGCRHGQSDLGGRPARRGGRRSGRV